MTKSFYCIHSVNFIITQIVENDKNLIGVYPIVSRCPVCPHNLGMSQSSQYNLFG